MMQKRPKYNFGLLETPGDSTPGGGYEPSLDTSEDHPVHRCPSVSSISSARKAPTRTGPGAACSSNSATSSVSASASRSAASRTPRTSSGARHTPHTTTSSSGNTPAVHNSTVILAIVEGRGLAKGEVGMASIDLRRPVLVLSQFSDSQTYAKVMSRLNVLHPLEIVMPSTAYETGNSSKLLDLITTEFPHARITTVNRKYFNEEKGLQYIKSLCLPEFDTVEMTVRTKYYCLATVSALLKYVEFIQHTVYAPASLRIVFKGSEHTTMIDMMTVTNLELLLNVRDARSEHTLYGVINVTKTRMGARLLRANILQPSCDVTTIETRLDVVELLTRSEDLFHGLRSILGRFLDVDHLLSLCVQIPKEESIKAADNKITTVIYLKHTIEELETLRMLLATVKTDNVMIRNYQAMLSDERFNTILGRISEVIHDDARYLKGALGMRMQKCFAVKPGINGLLDVARRTYSEVIDDINELIKQTGVKHGLPLKTSYNALRGFHIQLCTLGRDCYNEDSLPDEFVKVTKAKNTLSFTTADLIKMNDRVKESMQEIYIMSSSVLSDLMTELRQQIGCLYHLADCIAMLDMLSTFAHSCTVSNYTRPEFTDTLAIKQGRHPILEKISFEPAVPNNTFASDESNFVVITGPNMSGKSTYLRQIALLQIMAQIGSFVPAQYASFRIADQIFSRIGNDDNIETNSSTFIVEMREMSYIVQHATAKSLIIIDELGRGTSADEGYAICHAVCEHLLSIKSLTFFATHFTDLTSLSSLYPNVENYHFGVKHLPSDDGRSDHIDYTHVMQHGKTTEKHYGIRLAEMSSLPHEIIVDARQICQTIADSRKKSELMTREVLEQRAAYRLAKRLEQTAVHSRLDTDSLRRYLQSLKDQYVREVAEAAQVSSQSDVEE